MHLDANVNDEEVWRVDVLNIPDGKRRAIY
jgi:hypothetical protein